MRFRDLDSRERPLYVSRPVLNAADILAWAKEQGFASTLPPDDLHVTVAYSRAPVAWHTIPPETHTIEAVGGDRAVTPLGNAGAVVLKFAHDGLADRWQRLRDAGCSWDHPGYQPHVSLTYDGKDMSLDGIEPYAGPILLGPETFAELDEDWGKKVKEERLDESTETGGFWITRDGDLELCDREDGMHHAQVAAEILDIDPEDEEYTDDFDDGDTAIFMAYKEGWIRGSWMIGEVLGIGWKTQPSRAAANALLAFWRDGHATGFKRYAFDTPKESRSFTDAKEAYAFLRQALKGKVAESRLYEGLIKVPEKLLDGIFWFVAETMLWAIRDKFTPEMRKAYPEHYKAFKKLCKDGDYTPPRQKLVPQAKGFQFRKFTFTTDDLPASYRKLPVVNDEIMLCINITGEAHLTGANTLAAWLPAKQRLVVNLCNNREFQRYPERVHPEDLNHLLNTVLESIEHELRHAVQEILFKAKDQRQVEMKPGYGEHGDAYFTSGTEFDPQIGSAVHDFVSSVRQFRKLGVKGDLAKWFGQYVGTRPGVLANGFKAAPLFRALKRTQDPRYRLAVKKFYVGVMHELAPRQDAG